MSFNITERKDVSASRQALGTCLEIATVASRGNAGAQRVVEAARGELADIDQGYEVASRAQRMIDQILAGDWPETEVPGIVRALEATRDTLGFADERESLLQRVVNACLALDTLSDEQKDTLNLAMKAMNRVSSAHSALRQTIGWLERKDRKGLKEASKTIKAVKANLH